MCMWPSSKAGGPSRMALSKPEFPTISFADVVKGRDADVRVTRDNLVFPVDLAMVMSGKNVNDANEVLLGSIL